MTEERKLRHEIHFIATDEFGDTWLFITDDSMLAPPNSKPVRFIRYDTSNEEECAMDFGIYGVGYIPTPDVWNDLLFSKKIKRDDFVYKDEAIMPGDLMYSTMKKVGLAAQETEGARN